MSFLKNCWYPAAWTHEVADAILARTFHDIPVMMYRTSEGKVIAMHDRCPHRFAPLSYGRIENDKALCIYHGLEFDQTGACVGTQLCFGGAPKVAKVRTFPTFEQDHIVWIWMGDKEAADTALVTRFAYHSDPGYRTVYGYKYTKCDYRLLNDNLMDLTHIVLLHPVFDAKHRQQTWKSWEEGDRVCATYFAEEADQEYHTVNTARWAPPSMCDIEINVIPDFGKAERIVEFSAHLFMPETAKTSHYLWSYAVPIDSHESEAEILARNIQVISVEDAHMLEGVQARMGDADDIWELNPLLIATDSSSVRVRRKLAKLIAAESHNRELATKQPEAGQGAADEKVAILERAVDVITR